MADDLVQLPPPRTIPFGHRSHVPLTRTLLINSTVTEWPLRVVSGRMAFYDLTGSSWVRSGHSINQNIAPRLAAIGHERTLVSME